MPRLMIQPDSPLARTRRQPAGSVGTATASMARSHAGSGASERGALPLSSARTPRDVAAARPTSSRAALRPDQRATLHRILNEKYEYTDHELLQLPDDEAYRRVFTEAPEVPAPDVSWYHPMMDLPQGPAAPNWGKLNGAGGGVLLTAAQERVLFTQFNYCRKQVFDRREQLLGEASQRTAPTRTLEREALDWYTRAEALRTQIADTNLALVLAMAKRSRIHHNDFADLISEGNMALLRAVDKFDVGRGFKFSTYACRAILKAFSRQGIKLSKHRSMFPVDFDPKLERSNFQSEKNAAHENDCADEIRRIIALNKAELSDVERTVVAARFNVSGQPTKARPAAPARFRLDPEPRPAADDPYKLPALLRDRDPDAKPLTLEQVGKLIGVTKERVRQIQNKALEKIRTTLEEDYLA